MSYTVLEHAQCGGVIEPICRGIVGYISWRIDECVEQLLQRCPHVDSAEEEKYRGYHYENPTN